MEGRKEKNSMVWNRGEFLFCIVVLWTAAIFQGYAVYQEWREEPKFVESFRLSGTDGFERPLSATNWKMRQ